MIKQSIDQDLKQAMLAGDKDLVSVLRTIKSVILDAEIKAGARDSGLPEETVVSLLQKESKKRGEAAQMYDTANDADRANAERYEQEKIKVYLPAMMDDARIQSVVDSVLADMGDIQMSQMGQVIGAVKAKTGPTADGAVIARIVKEQISKK